MKRLTVLLWVAVALALFCVNSLQAATYTVTTSQNWSALSPQPTSADAVAIQNGATLTVDVANGACASIQVGVSGGGNGTLSFQDGKLITCAGSVVLGDGSSSGSLLMVFGGTLKVGGSLVFTPGVSGLSPG